MAGSYLPKQTKKIHIPLSLSVYSFPTLIVKPLQEHKHSSITRVLDWLARCACWVLRLLSCAFPTAASQGLTWRRWHLSHFPLCVFCKWLSLTIPSRIISLRTSWRGLNMCALTLERVLTWLSAFLITWLLAVDSWMCVRVFVYMHPELKQKNPTNSTSRYDRIIWSTDRRKTPRKYFLISKFTSAWESSSLLKPSQVSASPLFINVKIYLDFLTLSIIKEKGRKLGEM